MSGCRILLLRHERASRKTAASLSERGYSVMTLPLSKIKTVSTRMPHNNFDGVIFTSPLAPQILQGNNLISGIGDLPIYCVGEYTASCARQAGFSHIEKVEKDANSLSRFVEKLTRINRLLYPCGKERSFDFAGYLKSGNIQCVNWEIYANQLIFPNQDRIRHALEATDIVFLFSKRTASHFFDVAGDNIDRENSHPDISSHVFIAISENVAACVPRKFQSNTYIAGDKSERAMIELIVSKQLDV